MDSYSVLKSNKLSSIEKPQKKLKCISVSERGQSEKAAVYNDSNCVIYGKGKTKEIEKISACQVLGGRKVNRESTEDFYDSENILYDTSMVDICHYRYIQTHRMYNTKNEP